jgi:hypothetical protein
MSFHKWRAPMCSKYRRVLRNVRSCCCPSRKRERPCSQFISASVAVSEGHPICPSSDGATAEASSPFAVAFEGRGFIWAILRMQSASEACGPETKVPLIFVEYHPAGTPRRRASSVWTWRGARFFIGCFLFWPWILGRTQDEGSDLAARAAQLSPESRAKSASTAATKSR